VEPRGETTAKTEPWFGPEDAAAVADFWAIYDGHVDLAALMRETSDEPRLAGIAEETIGKRDENAEAMRAMLRAAFAGDWAPYEATLRMLGATYARQGFTGWTSLTTTFSRRLVPLLVAAYHGDAARLSAALLVMVRFLDRAARTLGDAYLHARETLAHDAELALRASAEQLRHSEERHRTLFEASPVPMLVFAKDTRAFLAVNDAALAMYGYTRAELLTMHLNDLKLADADPMVEIERGQSWAGVRSHVRRDGSVVRVEIASSPLAFEGRAARLFVVIDVTEKESLEAQLRQSQKMEAFGSLAGGVAHDFNNILSVILSYSDLIAQELGPDDPRRADLEEIREAARRAAALTRQLLAFGRRQVLQPRTLQLEGIVSGIHRMLERLIGEDIELVTRTAPALGAVHVDPGQIEQIIVNLAVNARDAMPRGGTLTITTASVEVDAAWAAEHPPAKAGPHIVLTLSDTGTGMDAPTKARIFEPFFTTKDVGKGTGLGLSTVFGIVRQSGGIIEVESELGKGTTFTVYFPVVAASPKVSLAPAATAPAAAPRAATILLVEDDGSVRGLARTVLVRAGYQVLEAENGPAALARSEAHHGAIDLLLTDVVMPRMSGREVAEQLCARRPELRVLFMSGYPDDAILRHGILERAIAFLPKPLTPTALLTKVREVLA
jgi:two-component system, cell cycle sensor histidine kinase and response regulator CckA